MPDYGRVELRYGARWVSPSWVEHLSEAGHDLVHGDLVGATVNPNLLTMHVNGTLALNNSIITPTHHIHLHVLRHPP